MRADKQGGVAGLVRSIPGTWESLKSSRRAKEGNTLGADHGRRKAGELEAQRPAREGRKEEEGANKRGSSRTSGE